MVLKGESVGQLIGLGEAICHMADGMEGTVDGGVKDVVEFEIAGVQHILRSKGNIFTVRGDRHVRKNAVLEFSVRVVDLKDG